jgi:hypothetical protein
MCNFASLGKNISRPRIYSSAYPSPARKTICGVQKLYSDFVTISEEIDEITQSVTLLSKQSPRYDAIRNIPGFGPILTTALISEVGADKKDAMGAWYILAKSSEYDINQGFRLV